MSRVAQIIDILEQIAGLKGISPPPLPIDAEFPYITVHEVINTETQSMSGPSKLSTTVVQINCWDVDYDRVWEIRAQVKSLLTDPSRFRFRSDHELYDGELEKHQLISRIDIWQESDIA